MSQYDTSEPILILVRRGRNGRGFLISTIEDMANSAACLESSEIGDIILEMLNDTSQPRVNINDLLSPNTDESSKHSSTDSKPSRRKANEPEEEEEEEDDEEDFSSGGDLADKMILMTLGSILGKGRSMSSAKVRPSGRTKKKKG